MVVSRLDHDANVRPWVLAAEAAGATVRWAAFDPATGELTADDVAEVLTERTRLVAVTGASNLIGTRPPVAEIAARVHAAGALLAVDGVHLTAHAPVDVRALGRRLLHLLAVQVPRPALRRAGRRRRRCWRRCAPAKLLPSSDDVPERFELGTLPYELLAGTTAAVDFLAGLGDRRRHPARAAARRDGRRSSSTRTGCASTSRRGWRSCPASASGRGPRTGRRPCCSPSTGTRAADAYRFLAERGVNAPAGHFYAIEASRWLGLGDTGGLRVGLAPYTDADDVDRLLSRPAGVPRRPLSPLLHVVAGHHARPGAADGGRPGAPCAPTGSRS